MAADLADDFKTGNQRQTDIGDDEIRLVFDGKAQGLKSVPRRNDEHSRLFQQQSIEAHAGLIVVHDQRGCRHLAAIPIDRVAGAFLLHFNAGNGSFEATAA